MEFLPDFFAAFSDDVCCPDNVHEHNPESKLTSESMRFENIKHFCRNKVHSVSAADIEQEAEPETDDVPGFEVTSEAFRPDTDGIEHERKSD